MEGKLILLLVHTERRGVLRMILYLFAIPLLLRLQQLLVPGIMNTYHLKGLTPYLACQCDGLTLPES